MSSPSPWTWDPARQSYFYWSQQENAWVYQDQSRVYAQPASTPPAAVQQDAPRAGYGQVQIGGLSAYGDTASIPSSGSGDYTHQQPSIDTLTQQLGATGLNDGQQPGSAAGWSALSPNQMHTYQTYGTSQSSPQQSPFVSTASYGGTAPYGGPASYDPTASHAQTGAATTQASARQSREPGDPLERAPPEEITEEKLYRDGVMAHGRIRGTTGREEKLDPNFKIRFPGSQKFFVVGKVIKILWPELAGSRYGHATFISDRRFPKEGIATKIRWFVVVKKGDKCCSCLPISTYEGQGVAKVGTKKWQHAIAFVGSEQPRCQPGEVPAEGEKGMMGPIRVVPKKKQDKMHDMSRINFAKIYTVEHNVKVYDFGDVHRDYLARLRHQWKDVLGRDEFGRVEEDSGEDDG